MEQQHMEFHCARDALSQMESRRRRDGMTVMKIEKQDESGTALISQTHLRKMVYGKSKPAVRPRDRSRCPKG